jgi:enoyl-CoA hydratase
MSENLVLIDRPLPGLAELTLNRPQALNALSQDLRRAFSEAIDTLRADPSVRVLILTGAGRAFCAGMDLKEVGAANGPQNRREPGGGVTYNPVVALERFPGPVIGAINGLAVTGGFELALACDVLLASPNARFADTHGRIGLAPDWGLSQKLSRAIGIYRANEVSFSGNWIAAEQAAAWGFVNRVVPADRLLADARALAADMLGALPEMLLHYKAVIRDGFALPFGQGLALERERGHVHNAKVKAGDVESRREAVRAHNRG